MINFPPMLSAAPRVYLGIPFTRVTINLDQWPRVGAEGRKFLILITVDRWKRHFREKNYIGNYFYLLKSTKSTKSTFQKCWRNIIWVIFLGRPYGTNGIKTRLGSLVILMLHFKFYSSTSTEIACNNMKFIINMYVISSTSTMKYRFLIISKSQFFFWRKMTIFT